jgi:dephospho-CoA kinase
MALIYITGPTGAGKTTIRNELLAQGYEAFDTDEGGIAEHQDAITKEVIIYPSDPSERTPEWQARHAFNLSEEKLKVLAGKAKEHPVFLCGAASNDLELAVYFDSIICLELDEDVSTARVLTRETNNYGKAEDELREIQARHQVVIDKYKRVGAVMLSADQPLESLVEEVIDIANSGVGSAKST